MSKNINNLRRAIEDNYLAPENDLVPRIATMIGLSGSERMTAKANATLWVKSARENVRRSGLIDKFLQEYGLSTSEGVTLMRLAEAMLRTPDTFTVDALIKDKIGPGNWSSHKGKSPFALVNLTTRALMLTAAWLDEINGNAPFADMRRATKAAIDRLGEPVIRASVAQAMRIMGEHFVLGETIEAALQRSKCYRRKGYAFSYDMLGEAALTETDAEAYFRKYSSAIAAISNECRSARVAENPGISVKLSALHPRYEFGKKARVLAELSERVRKLAYQAKSANMGFTIDAEEADRLELSLDLIADLLLDRSLKGWNGLGVVVQAYQRRAPFVIEWLTAFCRENDRRIMVRLVKGAYWDAEIKRAQEMGLDSYPVFTRKIFTDLNYLACARKLLQSTDVSYPQFATHNALTVSMVQSFMSDHSNYELQRLHGMGEHLHDHLIASGARSRIYAPVGGHDELLPYLVRRLLENGANSSFVNQLMDPSLSVESITSDPITLFAALSTYPNPSIPSPREYLRSVRKAAKGWDHTHPPVAAGMSRVERVQLSKIQARPIIGGAFCSGEKEPVRNPAFRNDIIGWVENANSEDVVAACNIAAEFHAEWASSSIEHRASILGRAADLLEKRGDEFMALTVFEAGKCWPDAVAEIREAVDFLRYYAEETKKRTGEPLGVVACISPWNFPLAIFLGQVSAALAAGNCVIAKPAEQTPLIAFQAVCMLHEVGVPPKALQYLPGNGATVGAGLVAHPKVDGVVFTGSNAAAQEIKHNLAESNKFDAVLIAETGGINVMIVDSTALLEQAVKDAVASAFQSAGQRCSACRVVCVQDDIADRFIEMLAGSMAELSIGDPANLDTDVGPVIDEEARVNIKNYIDRMREDSILVADAPIPSGVSEGDYVEAVAFEIRELSSLEKETFGPVLHILRFNGDRLDALVDDINAMGYGLTLGVHSRIDKTIDQIVQRARVGNIYVNRNQIGAVVGVQPFGGEGLSGTGPKAGGPHYLPGLMKRPRSNCGDSPTITERAPTSAETAAIMHADEAYVHWNTLDRVEALSAVLQKIPAAQRVVSERILSALKPVLATKTLPGPTGELNQLKLHGRGVALCLGGEDHQLQMVLALAAGNTVITIETSQARVLKQAIDSLCLPKGILSIIAQSVPESFFLDNRVRLIAHEGDKAARHKIEKLLSRRAGAIVPLLSSQDEVWRYCTERTVTINTTAAGGNAELLAIAK